MREFFEKVDVSVNKRGNEIIYSILILYLKKTAEYKIINDFVSLACAYVTSRC